MSGDVVIRPMAPADAVGVAACVERCYGGSYPKPLLYRPSQLAASVASDSYSGVVATAGPTVVGHIGFTQPAAASMVVEAGTTVVDPAVRGTGVMRRLAAGLVDALVARGTVGFVHFPTTAHPVMQRASLGAGGRETGILVAYLPADARDPRLGAAGPARLAVTIVYQPVSETPSQQIFVPKRYEQLIRELAAELRLARDITSETTWLRSSSSLRHKIDEARDLCRITVDRIGEDIGNRVASIAEATRAAVLHADLPMDDPGIDAAVEQLKSLSFAFAGWLPGWNGHDVLRLQRVTSPGADELDPMLISPEAQSLMTRIRRELVGLA